ncbi:MAG TPA: hypothetical protein VF370_00115 [Candidatus Cryosericum sp.]
MVRKLLMNSASTAFGETMHGDFTAIVSEELFLRVQAEAAPGIPVAAMDVGVPQ